MKRRQSASPEQEWESKRQRISPGKNSPSATRDNASRNGEEDATTSPAVKDDAPVPKDPPRKASVVDEKQRSKRLFGALLGNLKQPGDRTSKRRQEIETRRKAELQRQDDERLEDRQKRLKKLEEQRKIAKGVLEERNVRWTSTT